MKILAIDSSGLVAGAAVMEDDRMTAEFTVNFKKTHSQTLLPMIAEIVRMSDCSLKDLDAIAVADQILSLTSLTRFSSVARVAAILLSGSSLWSQSA